MPKHSRTIALGGTFDHLHSGHERFLTFASELGGQIIVGLTTERMNTHKPLAQLIQPFGVRKRAVLSFCQRHNINCQVVPLDDPYGPVITDANVYGLALTEMTVVSGERVNPLRQKLGLRPLETFICTMLRDETGEIISSTRIRAGEIDRQGTIYQRIFRQPLTLNPQQREYFGQIQGEIVNRFEATYPSPRTCVVGDMSVETFLKHNDKFHLAVFDLRQQKIPVASEALTSIKPDRVVVNPAGTISPELVTALSSALAQREKFLFVDGEEDLAAVVLVLLLPLQSVIYYGQPNQGMVAMTVTEGLKHTVYTILNPNLSQR
jgi:pantetheine-phosphate adenylyltransferase